MDELIPFDLEAYNKAHAWVHDMKPVLTWQKRFVRKVNKCSTCLLLEWYITDLSLPDEQDGEWSLRAAWMAEYVEEELRIRVGELVDFKKHNR